MDFDEAFTIELPNSHTKIQSTTSFSHGADCHRIQNGPVLPNIIITNTLSDKIHGRDKVLEYLFKVLSN